MAMINFQFSNSNFQTKRGFALLIAVIFMSVMLALGLAVSSLGYKQQTLASSAIESQYAFYAADSALECTLYADQKENLFDYSSHSASNSPNSVVCDNAPATQLDYSYNDTRMYLVQRIQLDENRCADITVYKYRNQQPPSNATTYLFLQGYDTSCTNVENSGGTRFVSRGISSYY